ncbi:MAG: metallophosphoesterase [Candidatus Thorarchaeota archaeon]|nr:metallophosphoesterase [Candidatus Thorarchaeota archaeon]
MPEPVKTIFHLSDIHVGEAGVTRDALQSILSRIEKRSERTPSPLILITGDLTTEGLLEEYEEFADALSGISVPYVIIPGNHDERNYGSSHFEKYFGRRFKTHSDEHLALYAADSAEPDNDAGHVGRTKYGEIMEFFGNAESKVRIFAMHHHLLPVPHTGREHNIVEDAGDVLGVLEQSKCSLVLSGHRHVPWMWRLNDIVVYTTGTLLSRRTRGASAQVHTLIELFKNKVSFTLVDRTGEERKFADSILSVDWAP